MSILISCSRPFLAILCCISMECAPTLWRPVTLLTSFPLMRKTELLRLAVLSLAVAKTSLVLAQVIDPDKTGGPPVYHSAPALKAAPGYSRPAQVIDPDKTGGPRVYHSAPALKAAPSYSRPLERRTSSTSSGSNSSLKNSSSAETTPHSSPARSPSSASSPSRSPSARASTSPMSSPSASAAKKTSKKAKSIDPDKTGGPPGG